MYDEANGHGFPTIIHRCSLVRFCHPSCSRRGLPLELQQYPRVAGKRKLFHGTTRFRESQSLQALTPPVTLTEVQDGSFRGGMVASTDICHDLEQHPEKFGDFFRTRFPGIIPDLLTVESATEQFVHNQHISLRSVKCGKFGYEDSGVLLGDSSHNMVPFHAMGMITGLEDVRVFFEDFVDPAHRASADNGQADSRFCPPGVVQRYTDYRRPDVQAMTDMAAEHYHELRIGVKSKASRAKKTIESTLQRYAPTLDWATLYSRIQFGHERFSVVRKKEDQQKRIINSFAPSLFVIGVLATALLFFH